MKERLIQDWQAYSERRLRRILKISLQFPELARLGPTDPWTGNIQLVNRVEMTRLNQSYRKKGYPTDVLSFPAPVPFRRSGYLGDLVICLPVLKSQARAFKHTPDRELDILLIHGLLHLLGLDHEKSPRQAAKMAKWESRMLRALLPSRGASSLSSGSSSLGLIDRADSGNEFE